MDDLSESHWNDVVTASTVSNYADILHENGFQSGDDEDDADSNPYAHEQEPEDEEEEEQGQTAAVIDHSNEPEPELDPFQQAQKDEETKQILSSLTNGDTATEEVTLSKDDNLFNNIDVGDLKIDDTADENKSPVKKRSTKIMYKQPRFRRSAQLSETHDKDLGPLNLVDDEDDDTNVSNFAQSPLRREKLINSIDKPLFDINSPSPVKSRNNQPALAAAALAASSSSSMVVQAHDNDANKSAHQDEAKAEFRFDIAVGDPHKIGSELLNAHIQYSVTTKSNFPVLARVDEIVVERRYNDFLWLYNQLIYNHPGLVVPPPPEKQAVGRFNKNFIENRRLSLEKMLVNISQNPILQKDQDFIIFLSSENFSNDAKYREHNFEMEEDSGLISSITGAFLSSQPKYVEQDLYFVDQAAYVEALDLNLKNLYKSLELISGTRNDLVISVEEFNKYLKKMADLEINNELALIFTNYNELTTKIQDSIERFSMSEMLTVGNTIDEYIRLIQSVRVIFNQRSKLISSLQTNEATLAKKQKNLTKFRLKFHNQADKIKRYEQEIEDLEKLINTETQKRDELVGTIKHELKKFNDARLTDFKNTFEIYWESLIESQKELIELWETFYDNCKF